METEKMFRHILGEIYEMGGFDNSEKPDRIFAEMVGWIPLSYVLHADLPEGTLGACSETPNGAKIAISKEADGLPDGPLAGIICHELAHAIVGPEKGHRWPWKQMAGVLAYHCAEHLGLDSVPFTADDLKEAIEEAR